MLAKFTTNVSSAIWLLNIARGTTDPGYWVCNLNQISDWSQFENIIQVTDSIPWVRCASGNVFLISFSINCDLSIGMKLSEMTEETGSALSISLSDEQKYES